MNGLEELLVRIGLAAVEVDRLRQRQAAAMKARNKIACRRESNVSGGGRVFVDPCWKQWREVSAGYSPEEPDAERIPIEEQCKQCRRRWIRHLAFAAESRRLAGARRRVTMLARRYRRQHADAAVGFAPTTRPQAERRTR